MKRFVCLVGLVFLALEIAGAQSEPTKGQVKGQRKELSISQSRTCDLGKSEEETKPTFCSFLIENYASMQKTCGLAPAKSWLPWTWFRKPDPIKSIPSQVLNAIGEKTLNQPGELADLSSLSRLMSTVSATGTGVDSLLHMRGPDSVGNVLHFDPVLNPEIMLVPGEASAIHTLSCSDILSAALSAGVALTVAKASAKLSSEADTASTYKLVYGVFESPMFYMAETESWHQTYYFEALEWYLRSIATGTVPNPQWATNPGPVYIKSGRGIAIYSTLKDQSTEWGSGSMSGQWTLPLLAMDSSISDNATSHGQISTQVFHMILGDLIQANLPSPKQTGEYLSSTKVVHALKAPMYDATTQKLNLTLAIAGMPGALCSENVWKLAGDSSKAPHLNIESVSYVPPPSHPNGGTTMPSSSQCEFMLTADANASGDFKDALSPVTAQLPDNFKVQLGFLVPYKPSQPQLRTLLAAGDSHSNRGDWWYEVVSGDTINKNLDADLAGVKVTCTTQNTDFTAKANRSSTFSSLYQGKKGSYFMVELALPAGSFLNDCHLSGSVAFTAQNGAKLNANIPGGS